MDHCDCGFSGRHSFRQAVWARKVDRVCDAMPPKLLVEPTRNIIAEEHTAVNAWTGGEVALRGSHASLHGSSSPCFGMATGVGYAAYGQRVLQGGDRSMDQSDRGDESAAVFCQKPLVVNDERGLVTTLMLELRRSGKCCLLESKNGLNQVSVN